MAAQTTQQGSQSGTKLDRSIATYEVIYDGDGWTVLHEGRKLGTLDTRMAFDSMMNAARSSILAGHGVNIKLPHEIGIAL